MNTKCPYCESEDTIKRGVRRTQNRGKIQRYSCKACKKRFVVNDGFFRMRNTPHKITASMDMYYRGMSLRKTQEHLSVFYEHNASHVTILKWIRKYCSQIGKYLDNIQVKTSTQLTFDEMEYRTKGKDSFYFDIMDMETRYLIAGGYFHKRSYRNLNAVLKRAKKKATQPPTDVYTDGLMVYPHMIKKCYYTQREGCKVRHHVTKSTDKGFNWKIERLHENIRERTKTMRQFKKLHSAQAIMKGYEIFYNFMRKHQGINCYPYELATDLKLGENKWLDLIRLSVN
jgi:transposase-like protein